MTEQPEFVKWANQLPEERKRAVQHWFGTQMFIAKELGLDPDFWFEHVEWALKNPFDFTFLFKVPQRLAGRKGGLTDADLSKAKAVMGRVSKTVQPGSGGPGNIVGFMAKKKDGQKKGKRDRER